MIRRSRYAAGLAAWSLVILALAGRPAQADDGAISLPPGERPVPVQLGLPLTASKGL